MKKLLFLMMLVAGGFTVKAQNITNFTNCDIVVAQVCYTVPGCTPSVTANFIVPPGGVMPLPPTCVAPNETAWRICWQQSVCTMTKPCTFIDGNVPQGTCSGAPYLDKMFFCGPCSSTGNGVGYADFDPTTGDINVY